MLPIVAKAGKETEAKTELEQICNASALIKDGQERVDKLLCVHHKDLQELRTGNDIEVRTELTPKVNIPDFVSSGKFKAVIPVE